MEYVKLSEIAEVITKGTTPTSIGYNFCDEGINFIKIESINTDGKVLNDKVGYISEECHNKLKRSQLKENDILFSIAGAIGRTCIITKDILPANTNQALAIIRLKENDYDIEYLNILLNSQFITKQYNKKKQGVAQLNLSLTDIGNLEIPKLNITEQLNIKNKLKRINKMILTRKQEINKCTDLIKSQFVEMFGNPLERNNNSFFKVPMPEVCEIIDGDRGKNYPKQNEFFLKEYCLFLNAKNVTSSGFDFSNNMYITKEKDELLRNGKLKRGDVVLTTRGTVGNLAFYNDYVPYNNVRINSGMVILRMNHEKVNELFFIEQFKMQLDNIKIKIANGSALPQLPISKMNGIKVIIPPIELQNKFAQIVEQIDKQKFEFEKSLKKLEELQAALMQEYFG